MNAILSLSVKRCYVILHTIMNFLGFSVLTLAVLTQAATPDGKAKEKRGVADYQPTQYSTAPVYGKTLEAPSAIYSKQVQSDYSKSPLTFYSNPAPPVYAKASSSGPSAYSKSLADLLSKSGPALPQQQEYQEYYQSQPVESASQAVNYVPQPQAAGLAGISGGKASQGGSQKYAYALQSQSQPIYSSAADVSSFSYSSPVVAYNNHGFLHQVAGKGATSSRVAPVAYNTASSASKNQYQQYQQQQPKIQYVSVPSSQPAYSAASSGAGGYSAGSNSFSPSQLAYSSPNDYSSPSANYEDASNAYQQISQKALFSAGPEQPRAVTYQADPSVGQKVSYVQSPAAPIYQAKAGPVNYVSSAPQYADSGAQQYSNGLQQYATSGHVPQASASSPEYIFSQHVPQSQLFAVNPQTKYAKPGVTYA